MPPPPALSPAEAAIAPAIADMDARDLFQNAAAPELWTLDTIKRLNTHQLTRHQALRLQRYVLDVLQLAATGKRWAVYAATDTLGAIDASKLTTICLGALLRHTEALHREVFARSIIDKPTLRVRVQARSDQTVSECPLEGGNFRLFLTKVETALAALLP